MSLSPPVDALPQQVGVIVVPDCAGEEIFMIAVAPRLS